MVTCGTPGTSAMGDAVEPYLEGHNALLLANHGAVTMVRTELEPGAVAQLETRRARSRQERHV